MKKADLISIRIASMSGGFLSNRIHIAICSLAAVWAWSGMIGSALLAMDLILVPVVMLGIYQWNRLFDLDEDRVNSPENAARTVRSYSRIRRLSLMGIIAAVLFSSIWGERTALPILLTVVVLGFLYSTPITGFVTGKRLKNILFIKNLTSALGWSLLVVLYPAVHAGVALRAVHWLAAALMFVSVWVVELIWDIRDREGDLQAELKTVPVVLDIDVTVNLILTLNGSAGLAVIIGVLSGVVPIFWLACLLNSVLVHCWIRWRGAMLFNDRSESHLLVGYQTLILIALGSFTGILRFLSINFLQY